MTADRGGMKQISRSMFFYKKVFPVAWFGFIAFFILTVAVSRQNLILLAGPVFMAVLGFLLMQKLLWVLVDDVYDCGDFLRVRNHGDEENVALSNIMNVSATTAINPPRITLRLVHPGKFGPEIAFSPLTQFTLNPFAKNQVAEDLIVRVDQARSKRGA
jgi:hypothetical protein